MEWDGKVYSTPIPRVAFLVYSLFSLTSDSDHAFRLNLAPSLHLLPLPIRSNTGRWLSSLTLCVTLLPLDITSPKQHLSRLPLTAATVARPCQFTLSLISRRTKRARVKRRCMCDMCKSLVTVLWAQCIGQLTFLHVWQREGYLWTNAEFIDFSRLCQLLTTNPLSANVYIMSLTRLKSYLDQTS